MNYEYKSQGNFLYNDINAHRFLHSHICNRFWIEL
jgi:hypothetical protein